MSAATTTAHICLPLTSSHRQEERSTFGGVKRGHEENCVDNSTGSSVEKRLRPTKLLPVCKSKAVFFNSQQQRKRKLGSKMSAVAAQDSDSDDIADKSLNRVCDVIVSTADSDCVSGSQTELTDTVLCPTSSQQSANACATSGGGTGPSIIGRRIRKKARRARRRPHKGYYEMTETERTRMEERERQRAAKVRERSIAKGHMLAPYNTTQFLISDHYEEDASVKRLEQQLLHTNSGGDTNGDLFKTSPTRLQLQQPSNMAVRTRGRDSSFSLDSDEGYFYSSPEDEEEFISKEFSKDYERGNVDRLERMDKTDLINEYLGLEKKMEGLEKQLDDINTRETMKALTGEVDYEFHRGEVPMEPETADKIKVFQSEIKRLIWENKSLTMENAALKRRNKKSATAAIRRTAYHQMASSSSSSSSDESSSSDDDSSNSSSDSSSDEDDDEKKFEANSCKDQLIEDLPTLKVVKLTEVNDAAASKTDDTGYESTQSKEQTPEPDWNKVKLLEAETEQD